MVMHSILLVEDDKDIQEVNKNMLEWRGGYQVRLAMTLAEAKKQIKESSPDIILLDVMLPDGSGLDFLKELREDKNIPVLILSALGKTKNVIEGLGLGADDYLSKPYKNDELLARIESLLRRAKRVPETLTKGILKLEVYSNEAYVSGVNLMLTGREFDVLFMLMQNEDKMLSVEYIYEKIWSQPLIKDKSAVQTVISRLRKKIERSGYGIEMVRERGYIFTKI